MSDTATPTVIRREDYAPPAFLIDTVDLEFDLVPERTVVKSTLRVRRNPDAKPAMACRVQPSPAGLPTPHSLAQALCVAVHDDHHALR